MSSRLASLMIAYRMSISLMGVSPAALGVEKIRQYRAGDDKGIPVANLRAETRVSRRCHHAKK
jgi:hypothetical protein